MRLDTASWKRGTDHLRAVDPELGGLIERFPGETIQSSGEAFQVLANSIVGQQISVKAAAAIFGRLSALLGSWSPQAVLHTRDQDLRAAGLSARKVEYFRALAQAFDDGSVVPETWETESDARVMAELTALRGIGRWTAEMYLVFHLRRPDVLPLDDLGLLQSAARLYRWDYPFPPPKLAQRAEAWRPWRTVGVWYLWRALDPEPVVY